MKKFLPLIVFAYLFAAETNIVSGQQFTENIGNQTTKSSDQIIENNNPKADLDLKSVIEVNELIVQFHELNEKSEFPKEIEEMDRILHRIEFLIGYIPDYLTEIRYYRYLNKD